MNSTVKVKILGDKETPSYSKTIYQRILSIILYELKRLAGILPCHMEIYNDILDILVRKWGAFLHAANSIYDHGRLPTSFSTLGQCQPSDEKVGRARGDSTDD